MTSYPLLPVSLGPVSGSVVTPAKLNLFLEVEGRRGDGYHDITSVIAAVNLYDEIRIRPGRVDRLRIQGLDLPVRDDNLVLRALRIARRELRVPPVEIELSKRIPPGSGLGGGSGNAAGTLHLLWKLYGRKSPGPLEHWGTELGADVPFFFTDGLMVARGRGHTLRRLPGDPLGGDRPYFLLALPNVHSSTRAAYEGVSFPLTSPDGPISFHEKTFVSSRGWIEGLFNRLETPVLTAHPELYSLVELLERWVPGRWRMTGSGSVFFAVSFNAREIDTLRQSLNDEVVRDGSLQMITRVARGIWRSALRG